MKKDSSGVNIVDINEIDEIYGHTVEEILITVMEASCVRNIDIANKLIKIYELLNEEQFETDEYKEISQYLRKYLGDLDKEIIKIKLEEIRKRRRITNA